MYQAEDLEGTRGRKMYITEEHGLLNAYDAENRRIVSARTARTLIIRLIEHGLTNEQAMKLYLYGKLSSIS